MNCYANTLLCQYGCVPREAAHELLCQYAVMPIRVRPARGRRRRTALAYALLLLLLRLLFLVVAAAADVAKTREPLMALLRVAKTRELLGAVRRQVVYSKSPGPLVRDERHGLGSLIGDRGP